MGCIINFSSHGPQFAVFGFVVGIDGALTVDHGYLDVEIVCRRLRLTLIFKQCETGRWRSAIKMVRGIDGVGCHPPMEFFHNL